MKYAARSFYSEASPAPFVPHLRRQHECDDLRSMTLSSIFTRLIRSPSPLSLSLSPSLMFTNTFERLPHHGHDQRLLSVSYISHLTFCRKLQRSSSAWKMDTSVLEEDELLNCHVIAECRSWSGVSHQFAIYHTSCRRSRILGICRAQRYLGQTA